MAGEEKAGYLVERIHNAGGTGQKLDGMRNRYNMEMNMRRVADEEKTQSMCSWQSIRLS